MGPQCVIGVDLGGTKILAGRLDLDGRVLEQLEVPTPTGSQEALLAALDEAVEAVRSDGVAAIGCGVPSVLDRRSGHALGSTNIPLEGVPLAARLSDRFGVPAVVENDANVAALAEWRLGGGVEVDDLVLLTLGTGVGGGLVLGGELYRGWAELGHVVVDADGPPCQGTCTGHGHLEALVSGTAADRAAAGLWGEGATSEQLVARALDGDAAAVEALTGIGRLLGAAIGSLVNVFAPDVVIVGGGFGTAAAELLLGPALETAEREALPQASVRIVPAALGAEAGLIGAGLLAAAALGSS